MKLYAAGCRGAVWLMGLMWMAVAGAAEMQVTEAWVRAPIGKQSGSGVFMNIVSDKPYLIVGAHSDVAQSVELMEMLVADSGPMRPHKAKEIRIVAKEKNFLTPVSNFLMLSGLRRPLVPGEHVKIELELVTVGQARATQTVEALVKPFYLGASSSGAAAAP